MADAIAPKPEPPKSLEPRAQTQQFKGRPKRTPADQAEYFYNLRKMNVVFFASSLLMFASFLAMFWDDYDRTWKGHQRVAQDMELYRVTAVLLRQKADVEAKKGELRKIEEQIAERTRAFPEEVSVPVIDPQTSQPKRDEKGEKVRKRVQANYSRLREEDATLLGNFEKYVREYNFAKADYMTVRYRFEEAKHELEEGRRSKDPRVDKFEKHFRRVEEEWNAILKRQEELRREFEAVDVRRKEIQEILLAFEEPIEDLKKARAKITKDYEILQRRYDSEKPSPQNTARNLPMLDFFDPTLKIRQVVLPDIQENLNFVKVEKVDRCQTCHTVIDNSQYAADPILEEKTGRRRLVYRDEHLRAYMSHARGETPEASCPVCVETRKQSLTLYVPHGSWTEDDEIRYVRSTRAHPQMDLFVSGDSPHPLPRFGCTVCHGGDGRDTEFSRVVHIPENEDEEKDWKRRYGYTIRSYSPGSHELLWEHPMLPSPYVTSSCRRCHAGDVELAGGDEYVEGMKLFERVGCYACHRTDAYQILPKDLKDPKLDLNRRYRRPGPPLTHLKDKVEPDFVYKWILNPKHFRHSTKMPRFFGQSNARTIHALYNPETGRVEPVSKPVEPGQVEGAISAAIVKYLYSHSKTRGYGDLPKTESAPSAERGAKLFHQVGCTACHAVQPDTEYAKNAKGGNPDDVYRAPAGESWYLKEFAPNLNAMGSKTNAKWLYHWLKNPQHYFADTRMPDLRLTDAEALDVAEYLLSLRKTDWEKEPGLADPDPKLLDHLISELMAKKMPYRDVQGEIRRMSSEERILWLGSKMVSNFGCFSCHQMNKDGDLDWENTEGIGVEFTGSQPIGSKDVKKLDFGYTHWDGGHNYHGVSFLHPYYSRPENPVPYHQVNQDFVAAQHRNPEQVRVGHSRAEWIFNKVLDPRVYDAAKLESKPPDELLRMPNFYFNAEEARLLVTFVHSFTDHNVHGLLDRIRTSPDERKKGLQRGGRIVRENNCRGCHRFALDRFEFDYGREEIEPGKTTAKWKITRDTIEGQFDKLVDEDNFSDTAETVRMSKDGPEHKPDEIWKMEWVTDPSTLEMHPVLRKDSRIGDALTQRMHSAPGDASLFLFKKDGRWYYRRKADDDTVVEYEFHRHLPNEGGNILKDLSKFKESQGISMDRRANENPESRYPPFLRSQGAKTQPDWLFSFLKKPKSIRPNLLNMADLNVRMPTFGFTDEEAASLVNYFAIRDAHSPKDPYPYVPLPHRDEEYVMRNEERILWARDLFGRLCMECHKTGGKLPPGGAAVAAKFAPELLEMRHRLRPRWMKSWFEDPSVIYPRTSMSSADVAGRPHDGYDALVDYILNTDRYPLPESKKK